MIRRFALLQTFVAVARAGKMKQAAHELALTPGAVSQRIRQLEEAAGRRLFTRTSTGVELSAAGEAMFVALAEPFQAIEAVDNELGAPSTRRVTVSTEPSFAAAWLVPRLATFARLCPDIEVAVEVGTRPVDRHLASRGEEVRLSAAPQPLAREVLHLRQEGDPARADHERQEEPPRSHHEAGRLPGIPAASRLQPPGLAALVRSPRRHRTARQEGAGVFGKSPDRASGRRGTRTGARAGYLCR